MPVVLVGKDAMAKAKSALGGVSSKDWLGELAMRVSAGGLKLTLDTFREQRDPYGNPWAPLKRPRPRDRRAAARARRKAARAASGMGWNESMAGMMMPALAKKAARGPRVLVDTGRMRGSVGASPAGRTGRVVIPTWYAEVHQNGAKVAPHTRLRKGVLAHRAKMQSLGIATFGSAKLATFNRGFSIPRRMMLPDADRPLPVVWKAMIDRESALILRQKFGLR